MKFLANENIPWDVVKELRNKGYEIMRVDEVQKGMNDAEVLKLSFEQDRILITFDKDFGEKVFRSKASTKGIILLRFSPESIAFIIKRITCLLENFPDLKNKFIVVEEDRIRIKDVKP